MTRLTESQIIENIRLGKTSEMNEAASLPLLKTMKGVLTALSKNINSVTMSGVKSVFLEQKKKMEKIDTLLKQVDEILADTIRLGR